MSTTSEHLLKLAALNEFETALKYKTSYEELTEGMLGLMQEFLHYCDKNGIEIPDKETYCRIVMRVQNLICAKVKPDGSYHHKTPDDELPEPSTSMEASIVRLTDYLAQSWMLIQAEVPADGQTVFVSVKIVTTAGYPIKKVDKLAHTIDVRVPMRWESYA